MVYLVNTTKNISCHKQCQSLVHIDKTLAMNKMPALRTLNILLESSTLYSEVTIAMTMLNAVTSD